jgi:hypothetical protein
MEVSDIEYEENNALDQFYNKYPSMDSFLNEYPTFKNYILNCESTSQQLHRLNIVIVNIRNVLGWKVLNTSFQDYIIDIKNNENMHELAKINADPLLQLILKCTVHILWLVMEDAFTSPSFLEGEIVMTDIDIMKKNIYAHSQK